MEEARPHIFSQSPEDLIRKVQELGLPAFRGRQLTEWVFQKRSSHPEQMTNLSRALQQKLLEEFDWTLPEVHSALDGQDGATKLLLRGAKGMLFEAVILRYEGRTSLCVSSQVGCAFKCRFCLTGEKGYRRDLSAGCWSQPRPVSVSYWPGPGNTQP